jgi:hypothetical protein
MQMANARPWYRSRWWMPAVCLFLGTCVLVAFWVGGDRRSGVLGFAVLVGLGLIALFGRRSETISGLSGPGGTSAGNGSTSSPRRSQVSC